MTALYKPEDINNAIKILLLEEEEEEDDLIMEDISVVKSKDGFYSLT